MKQIGEYFDRHYTTVSWIIKRVEWCDTERPDPVFRWMGFSVLPPFLSPEIQSSGFTYKDSVQFDKDLKNNLSRWENHLKNIQQIQPLIFAGWADWDENGVETMA